MFFDEFLAEQQSEPGTGFAIGSRPSNAGIESEKFVNHFTAHADARISDCYFNKIVVYRLSGNCYLPSGRSKLQSVGNMVSQNGLKHIFVGIYTEMVRNFCCD